MTENCRVLLSRVLLVIAAVVISTTLAASGPVYGAEYDPTDPRDYGAAVTTDSRDETRDGQQESEQTETGASGNETGTSSEQSTEPASEQTSTETTKPSTKATTKTTAKTTAKTAVKTTAAKTVRLISQPTYKSRSYKGKNATRIPIITYHRVVSNKEKKCREIKNSSLFLSVGVFNRQMKWLHDHHYRTISTQEFYDWYTGKIKLPKKSVLITFDDGSYSVVKYALPVLKKYNMKATFFIIGKNTGSVTNKQHKNGRYHCVGLRTIRWAINTYPRFEFQSHTYNMHRRIGGKAALEKTSYSAQKADFTRMYDKYGFTFMAYPYGTYTKNAIKAAKASHIKMAFTYGSNGFATKKQSRYAIRRIKISANQPMKKFYRWFK